MLERQTLAVEVAAVVMLGLVRVVALEDQA